ncbi:MAG: CoA transferase [Gammaproteobacteria bacterium]|nr:CoA transferase [Gammaproteobacteria bacterium]MDH5302896.1 CoA transferase [Gammaproteobacteria bacterium]MDH5321001.1 CoA transferase [Gammaproteobacteria bacterium]
MNALDGIRVLDLSRMVAGAMAGMLLADFGADVVKVEQPGKGDPLRQWTTGGQSLWWKVYGRNKRCITLNLAAEAGRKLLLQMLPKFDVLMESFLPGTMESWGLGWNELSAAHPDLVLLRVSGWGRDGPDSERPGFGSLVEAGSGLAAMTGEPDRAPILPAAPIADMVSGLYAANAIAFALRHREAHGGPGQVIDVSLFESIFSVLGPTAAEYRSAGKVRGRSGSRSTNSAPRGCYATSDGRWIAVSGSTPKMAQRFLSSYGLGELLQDSRFATNEARVQHATELDDAIGNAIRVRTLAENLQIIRDNGLTACPVQSIADIDTDPHWQALNLLVDVADGAANVRMHNAIPRLSATPGEIRWCGAALGEHNEAIYCNELGLSARQLAEFRAAGVI